MEDLQKLIFDAVQSAIQSTPKAETQQPDDFLTVADVAALLRVTNITVYRYVSQEGLPHIKGRKNLIFNRSEVLKWFSSRNVRSNPATVQAIAANLKKKGGQ
jgi:excisionase family DNA binding protein